MTDVTIRGIDDETYAQFAAEAKKRGLCIGDLTTQAMRAMIADTSDKSFRIGDLDMLTVSKADLESIEEPIVLEDIEMLDFDDTVDWPTFKQHVKAINNVELMMLPKSLTKFQVLTKSKNIELIQSKK